MLAEESSGGAGTRTVDAAGQRLPEHTRTAASSHSGAESLGDRDNPVASWPRCPAAACFFETQFVTFATANPWIADLATRLRDHAGVDLRALVDHWTLPQEPATIATLRECGLVSDSSFFADEVWEHRGARLPRVRLIPHPSFVAGLGSDGQDRRDRTRLAISVEDVGDFLKAHSLTVQSHQGDPDSEYEEALCSMPHGELAIVARRGYRGFRLGMLSRAARSSLARARALIDSRERAVDELVVIEDAQRLMTSIGDVIGMDRAVDEFFAGERRFYMSRNAAARRQYERQQEMGIGWANHDHHTFRSSRRGFRPLMRLWSAMGFAARERFHAGADAGWGAQICEHPVSRVVIFSDVDLRPEECDVDYESADLAALPALGTIGLWCALHGSSICEAGMHHLEAEFEFECANRLLTASGYPIMKPFTDLPILKQAFTAPEYWTVAPERLAQLESAGLISREAAVRFAHEGAAGSHLELLQRWEGYKGFNKTGISNIIRETDARHA